MNDYLKEFEKAQSGFYTPKSYYARKNCTKKYGFAIPTNEVVRKIASYGKIIEMGAGTGYWAKLISEAGGDIIAIDKDPVGISANFYEFDTNWFDVEQGDVDTLSKHEDRVLFLCWPPYNNDFGARCLQEYKGDVLLYVGEGHYGCCGDQEFWKLLDEQWEEEDNSYMSIPQWDGIHDYFTIYRRK